MRLPGFWASNNIMFKRIFLERNPARKIVVFVVLVAVIMGVVVLSRVAPRQFPGVTEAPLIGQMTTSFANLATGVQVSPYPERKPLSPDSFFLYHDPEVAEKNPNPNEYTVMATGDVLPARSVNMKVVTLNNFVYPYEKTVQLLKTADSVFINLETPIVSGCVPRTGGMVFCGDPRNIEGLLYAGVDVVNLANNHMNNYGRAGSTETVNLLKQNGLLVTGHGPPVIQTIRDKKFGFLGYNDIGVKEEGVAWADISAIQKDVAALKQSVDFVIVAFHWGVEYVLAPTARQRMLGQAAVDAGADLVIGNHPHWVQGVEMYKGKLITYAHGNFVFDQMWSQETREGVVGKYTFSGAGLVDVQYYPVIIEDYAQPRFATELEARKILGRMQESTAHIISSVP